jgi:hypothetical protein
MQIEQARDSLTAYPFLSPNSWCRVPALGIVDKGMTIGEKPSILARLP